MRTWILLALVLAAVPGGAMGAAGPSPSGPGDPGPLDAPFVNVNVTDGDGNQNEVSLAVDMAGRVFMTWNDRRSGEPDYRCGMSTSLDRGVTWGANALYDDPAWVVAGDPVAVADAAGRTYLVCMPFTRGGPNTGTLVVLTSLDGGQTWVNTADIGISGANNMDDKPWAAAYGDGTIVVAWDDYPTSGGVNLVVRTSFDAGASWTSARTLAANAGQYPGLDFDRYGRLHLTYNDGTSMRYRYSDDFGLTWSPRVTVSATGNGCWGCSPRSAPIPQIASDPTGQDLYVIWGGDVGDAGGENVNLAYSHNAGQSWTRATVGNDTTERQFMPSVDVDHDGIVHMLWSDNRSGQHAVYYANSSDGGVTHSPDLRVSDAEAPMVYFQGDYQQIVIDDWGRAHLGYCDSRNGGDAFYARAELSTPGPHWVNITPRDPTVPLGSTLQFTATVTDPYGNTPPDAVDWRVSGGGAIDGAGLFTPSTLGTYTVRAFAGFRFDATSVTVVPGPLASILVSPPSAVVDSGNTQPFTATGRDAWGNAVPVSPVWSVDGGGSIDPGGVFTAATVGTWTVFANESGVSGSASVTVVVAPLASILVDPPTASITADQTRLFNATGYDAFGNVVPISPTWEVGNGSIAAGLYSPWSVGTWTVYANDSGISGNASVTVSAGAPSSIVVTPASATITADATQQFTATGYDAHMNPAPVNPIWSVTNGSISGTGLFSPSSVGTWTVAATDGLLSGTATVTVIAGGLARIDVSPPGATITADQTQPYTAAGFDAEGNVVPISPAWSTDGGSIDTAGLYSGGPVGAWTVTATDGLVSGTASITVTPGALASIVVTPPTATVTADQTLQYTAAGYDAKGNVVPISPVWSSDGGTIGVTGLYTGGPVGDWTVTATDGPIFGTAAITVTEGALASIVVTPPTATVPADATQQFTATGYDTDDNLVPIAPSWSVPGGSIDGSGLFTPDVVGSFTVTATDGGVSGTAIATVVPGTLATIVVDPPTATITADQTLQYTAAGHDSKGNAVPIAPAWTATLGSIDATGSYSPTLVGTFTITATDGGVSGTATVTVTQGELASIVVTPPSATIAADQTQQFNAEGFDQHGNPVPISPTWSATAGSLDATGLYTPTPAGTFPVTATEGGISGNASVTVVAGALAAIVLTPATAIITADETQAFVATGFDAKGNLLAVSPTWSATGGTIDATGLFSGVAVGTFTVTAAQGALSATAAIQVTPGAPASIEVAPATAELLVGENVTFTATVRDADGNLVTATITWSVDSAGTIGPSGRFVAEAAGEGTVTATVAGTFLSDTAVVHVTAPEVPQAFPWWLLVLLAIVAALILFFLLWRRRKERDGEAAEADAPSSPSVGEEQEIREATPPSEPGET